MSNKLPTVTSDVPRDLRLFLDRLRDVLGAQGEQRLLTADDLRRAGLARITPQGNLEFLERDLILSTPPAPTNLEAAGALRNIILTWDTPRYPGHAYAEIWRSDTDNIGTAVLLALAPGAVYADDVGPSQTKYYWVRYVNVEDTKGPFNAVGGVQGQTGVEVAYLLETLTNQITESQLFNTLGARIDLIDGPSSTTGTIPNQLAFLQGQIDTVLSYPDYDAAQTYVENDIVKYENSLYRATQTTTGNLPTDTDYWVNVGDYSSIADVVAAHTSDIATLTTNLSAEVTSRESLAAQLRGSYTGTDLSLVSAGLIFSERTARATADTGLATQIDTVSAVAASKNRVFRQPTAPVSPQLNDIWVDTSISFAQTYFEQEYAVPRFKQFQWNGTEWLNITDTDVVDNFAAITREQVARATADEALAQDITTVTAAVENNSAVIEAESLARVTADTALAQDITTVQAAVADTLATVQNEAVSRATADEALAQNITTVQASVTALSNSVDDEVQTLTAAVETEATARANADGTLFAQYTVKVDVNGYVSGFGLASTANNATPFSEFAIRADRFYVASPSGPGITPIIPFIVNTTPQIVNGVSVPIGVYMDAAFIKNGTITNAKIGNVAIDTAKIADAAIVEAKIGNAEITTAKIRDANITTAKILDAAITDAKIRDAAINNAKIENAAITTAKISDAAITTAKIANATITTAKITNAAITNALIGNAAITTAKIADAQITTAKIANAQITNAKIENAAITRTKIGAAAVDTLRIAGSAVTIPVGAVVVSASATEVMVAMTVSGLAAGERVPCFIRTSCRLPQTAAMITEYRINGGAFIVRATDTVQGGGVGYIVSSVAGGAENNFYEFRIRLDRQISGTRRLAVEAFTSKR